MNILTRKNQDLDIGFEAEKDKAGAKVTYFHNKIDDLISSQYQAASDGLSATSTSILTRTP